MGNNITLLRYHLKFYYIIINDNNINNILYSNYQNCIDVQCHEIFYLNFM